MPRFQIAFAVLLSLLFAAAADGLRAQTRAAARGGGRPRLGALQKGRQ